MSPSLIKSWKECIQQKMLRYGKSKSKKKPKQKQDFVLKAFFVGGCNIQSINSVVSNEDSDPPILVNFSIDGIILTFLIDSGADVNVISYEVFNTLKKAYIESDTTLTSFSNLDSRAIGKTSLLLQSENFQDESVFFLTEPKKSHHQAILGRAWMRKNRCSIDWDKNTISVTCKGSRISLPWAEKAQKPFVAPTSVLPSSNIHERQLFLKGTHDHEASTSSAPHVPKAVPYLSKIGIPSHAKRVYTTSHNRKCKTSKQGTKGIWI